jgi:hypothetical protein
VLLIVNLIAVVSTANVAAMHAVAHRRVSRLRRRES